MKKRKKSGKTIDSEKAVIVIFPEKANPKIKTMGWVQDMICTEKEVILKVKPIVYKACFEGKPTKFEVRGRNIGKFYAEIIKKFESSEHEVLVISERKASVLSKREFNKKLESMLHKMVTKKYWQELHKELKEDYVV